MTERATDCTLIVSIPIDRHEFAADVEAGTDLMRTFAAGRATDRPDVLWGIYERTLRDVLHVFDRVRRRGVRILTRGTQDAFLANAATQPIVTLVAHWRGARYRASDVVNPIEAHRCLRMLDAEASRVQIDEPATAEGISERLNQMLEHHQGDPSTHRLDDLRDASHEMRRQFAVWQSRIQIDQVLRGAVIGGPGVEFADGLAPVAVLAQRMPEAFSGTLDLTVCNSAVLAEAIRQRCHHGQIVCNVFPATLDVRMTMFAAAIDLMTRRKTSYVDAALAVRANIRRTL